MHHQNGHYPNDHQSFLILYLQNLLVHNHHQHRLQQALQELTKLEKSEQFVSKVFTGVLGVLFRNHSYI